MGEFTDARIVRLFYYGKFSKNFPKTPRNFRIIFQEFFDRAHCTSKIFQEFCRKKFSKNFYEKFSKKLHENFVGFLRQNYL